MFNEQGCKNLINAIYQRAAEDYIFAVITGDKALEQETGNFLVSGAYWKKHSEGRYIKEKCLKEIETAQKFIDDFMQSDLQKIYINRNNISFPILLTIKTVHYKDKLRIESRDGYVHSYLCKRLQKRH